MGLEVKLSSFEEWCSYTTYLKRWNFPNTFLDIGIFYLVSVAEYITGGWIKTSKA
jgi:hypothetical protein